MSTTAPFELRPYQRDALAALENAWTGQKRPSAAAPYDAVDRPAIVLPTGMGKTVIFSELIAKAHAAGRRPLVLVHREELAEQAANKIHGALAGTSARVGIVKATSNQVDADVIVASVQTIGPNPRRREQLRGIGLGIVDECHHAAARTWLDTIEAFPGHWAGFTATMTRTEAGSSKVKLGDVWDEVALERDILYGIREGYLVNVTGQLVQVESLELDEVKRSRGEMQAGDLGDALVAADAPATVAKAYLEHAADRQGILFAPDVPSTWAFANALNDAGVVTEVVTGETPTDERREIYARYRAGEVQVLANCMVLTEGFDMPQASCAVICRPTSNAALYVQMVGRVLRPYPHPPAAAHLAVKRDALVLDVVGISQRLKLASLTDLSKAKVKVNPGESLVAAARRTEAELGLDEGELGDLDGPTLGKVVTTQVDLFEASDSAWLRTERGIMFIPTKTGLFFLWPRPTGLYDLGRLPSTGGRATRLESDLTEDYGIAWAERHATDEDPTIASKRSSWRRRKLDLDLAGRNGRQLAFASNLKIVPEPGWTVGQLSDAISVKLASRQLDKMLAK
jgi:superfamily II DNA or RNA helicase